jgi:hypothetical protein
MVEPEGELRLEDSVLAANRAKSDSPIGGGLYLFAGGATTGARFHVSRNRIEGNSAESGAGQRTGGGFYVYAGGRAEGSFEDNQVLQNRLQGNNVGAGAGGALWATEDAKLEARRNRLFGNRDDNGANFPEQISLIARDRGRLNVSDSVIAGGATNRGHGALAFSQGQAILRLTNLTLVDSGKVGLAAREFDTATLSIANTIAFGHTTNLDTPANIGLANNLVGVDPKFVNRAAADYRLQAGSPAANKGKNAPPGGLGPQDIARTARVKGGRVDIGAYESF